MLRTDRLVSILAAIFLCFAVVLMRPYSMSMPTMFDQVLATIFAGLFIALSVFFYREHGGDEREKLLTLRADRLAFLSGAAVLMAAILYDVYTAMIDPHLVLALGVMIVVKIVSRWYGQYYS